MGHREELLAGARRCLEQRGYARTSARDLVAESGTNLASIGYHFGSKEALLSERSARRSTSGRAATMHSSWPPSRSPTRCVGWPRPGQP